MEAYYNALQAKWCEFDDLDAAIEAWQKVLLTGDDEVSDLLRDFVAVYIQNIGMRHSYDFWLCVVYSTTDLFEEFERLGVPFRGDGEEAKITTRVLIACALVAAKAMSDLTGRKPRVSDEILTFLEFHCGDEPKLLLRPKWALPAEMHHNTAGYEAVAPSF